EPPAAAPLPGRPTPSLRQAQPSRRRKAEARDAARDLSHGPGSKPPRRSFRPNRRRAINKPTLKSRQPNSESVKEASGFVNRLSQNGNLTVMTNEAASPKSLDSKMDGSTAVPRA